MSIDMKEFNELKKEELEQVVDKANTWFLLHKKYVLRIMGKVCKSYPPSGLDIYHPELWTGAHWCWYKKGETNGEKV